MVDPRSGNLGNKIITGQEDLMEIDSELKRETEDDFSLLAMMNGVCEVLF